MTIDGFENDETVARRARPPRFRPPSGRLRERRRAGTPACPHARACGACQRVDEPYAAQLARKDARVARLFGGFEGAELRPILGMDDPFRCRNKVVSAYAPGKKLPGAPGGRTEKGKGSRGDRTRGARPPREGRARHEILCGMYAAHSHRIVPTDGCLVENEQAKLALMFMTSSHCSGSILAIIRVLMFTPAAFT